MWQPCLCRWKNRTLLLRPASRKAVTAALGEEEMEGRQVPQEQSEAALPTCVIAILQFRDKCVGVGLLGGLNH